MFCFIHRRIYRYCSNIGLASVLVLCLSGCAGGAASIATNLVLGAIGIKKDQGPPPPKSITLQIHTADNLNADAEGRGLSAVLRIYKLKDPSAFNQATPDILNDAQAAKQYLGADLVESKEQLIIPGQRYQFKEKVDAQNGYLAVAILFRNPNLQRWKLSVPNGDLKEDNPLIIGAHACAINVTNGLSKDDVNARYLVSVAQCQR